MQTSQTKFRGSTAADRSHIRVHVGMDSSGEQQSFSFNDKFVIGHDVSSDVTLADERVEARHAEVYRVGKLWWVRDLGSEEGIYLDDELIDAAPLMSRSSLKLGSEGPRLWIG